MTYYQVTRADIEELADAQSRVSGIRRELQEAEDKVRQIRRRAESAEVQLANAIRQVTSVHRTGQTL